jgi:CO dehydrogenase nickel-insertion accessory protein CooC1
MFRKLLSTFIVSASLISFSVMAQETDKEVADLKKKIEMTIRRLDMRIDKVNDDQGKTKNQQVMESANEFKAKMESQRVTLREDLKKLPAVTKQGWKDYAEEVGEHIDKAKESAKPVVL